MNVEAGQELPAILAFLERIGLPAQETAISEATFLPGLTIRHGRLVYDAAKLAYPGDLLHEAGHLAVMTPEARLACNGDAGPDAGAEIAAIAWSYAASVEIGLDPRVVFHEHGYKSGASALAENLAEGRYIGVPLLQWFGMTLERADGPGHTGAVYPRMAKWLRE